MRFFAKLYANNKLFWALFCLVTVPPVIGLVTALILALYAAKQAAFLAFTICILISCVALSFFAIYAIVLFIISIVPKWRISFIHEQKYLVTKSKNKDAIDEIVG